LTLLVAGSGVRMGRSVARPGAVPVVTLAVMDHRARLLAVVASPLLLV
jgi:hypothetical protein